MAKGLVIIDEDRCKACALCIPVCPKKILALSEERLNAKGYPPITVTDPDSCTGCALCAVICPDVVFTVYRKKRQKAAAAAEG